MRRFQIAADLYCIDVGHDAIEGRLDDGVVEVTLGVLDRRQSLSIERVLLNRLIANQLWGVEPHDPLTMATVIAIILMIGTVACLAPAKRATGVEPLEALRYE